ncbi:DUF6406 domain-containing protein [Streptomyces sp. NPDC018031]|uniref:DUF6406 domain-containing protein n=1 Tax=Streptomyces sp. NPDC018031 TaxID=3365033 RepID=UPI0037AC6EAC
MKAARYVAVLGAALLAAGCGGSGQSSDARQDDDHRSRTPASSPSSSSSSSSSPASSPAREPAPPRDKGPRCDGEDTSSGLRVLRGGAARLPGGGALMYREARADGTSREAVLAEGETPAQAQDGRSWTVRSGGRLTVGGRPYTVTQICAYRVVLTPGGKPAKTTPPHQGDDVNTWPSTVDGRWRLRWHVPHTRRVGESLSVVVRTLRTDPARADISVVADGLTVASYEHLRPGDTVEIAGRLWRVSAVEAGNTEADAGSADFEAGYVDLQRIDPGEDGSDGSDASG